MTGAKGPPYFEFTDPEGVTHSLYVIDAPATIERVTEMMSDKQLFIADGHHRYETALAFKREMREKHPETGENAPFNYCMMTLVNAVDEGLTILPTHRLVKNVQSFDGRKLIEELKSSFTIEELPFDPNDPALSAKLGLERLEAESSTAFAALFRDTGRLVLIGVRNGGTIPGTEHLSPAARRLDVNILHDGILEPLLGIDRAALAEQQNLDYGRNAERCFELLLKGDYQAVFLLRPTKVEQVMEMALAGETMPQKSTDFYPKVLSGFVMADLSGEELPRPGGASGAD